MHGFPDVTSDNWLGVDEVNEEEEAMIKLDDPFDAAYVTTQTPQEAYEAVLRHAGASLPKRDRVDARITEDARSGTATYGESFPGIIDHPDDVGGYPVLESTTPPADTTEMVSPITGRMKTDLTKMMLKMEKSSNPTGTPTWSTTWTTWWVILYISSARWRWLQQ